MDLADVTCEDCIFLSLTRHNQVSAWEDFETNSKRPQVVASKGRKTQTFSRLSRYGYETLEDKYRFKHHEDSSSYIEDYNRVFLTSNRGRKKSIRSVQALRSSQSLPLTRNTRPPVFVACPSLTTNRANLLPADELKDANLVTSQPYPDNMSQLLSDDDVDAKAELEQPEEKVLECRPLKCPPPISGPLVDQEKDTVMDEDESHNDVFAQPVEPLLSRLNTFFMSRVQRRKTPSTSNGYRNGFFPHINPAQLTNQDQASTQVEMTPASIINYRVPASTPTFTTTLNNKASTKHHQILTQSANRPPSQKNELRLLQVSTPTLPKSSQPSSHHSSHKQIIQNLHRSNAASIRTYDFIARSVPAASERRENPIGGLAIEARTIQVSKPKATTSTHKQRQVLESFSSHSRSQTPKQSRDGGNNSNITQQTLLRSMIDSSYSRNGIAHTYLTSIDKIQDKKTANKAELYDYGSLYMPSKSSR